MGKTAWLATKAGFEEVEILEETSTSRTLLVKSGAKSGQTVMIPPVGRPHGDFHPALYIADQKPNVFQYKGRSLRVLDSSEFPNPEQAAALVPAIEPYTFLPHTSKLIDGIIAGDHQLLFGGTGVGKTSLVLQIAARIGQPVIRLNFNGQVSVSDLVGSVGFGRDGTTWNDGALPRAMRNGFWIVLDEIDFAAPEILSIFYPVLEAAPALCLKEHDGEIVKAQKCFRVFATGNSIGGGDRDGAYCGTQQLNAALLNRFTGHGQAIKIEPMTAKQESAALLSRMPNLPKRLVRRACDLASRLRCGDGQSPPLLPTFSTRELIQFCQKMLLYRDPIEAASITFLSVVEDANKRQPIEQAISLIMGRRIIVGRGPSGRNPPGASTRRSPAARSAARPAESAMSGEPKVVEGRTATQVTDPSEMQAIWEAYKGNGGTLSFAQIEAKFGLRKANGSTAYRIIKKVAGMKKGEAGTVPAGGAEPEKPSA